ncbi:hypothetical protein [Flavivirga sp. 57AJ16]|uniref:hypothetical protein n=1 Tax=Flavivirga sp. 57AJ16 TaxID=3025307 RepID=UPI002367025A|nr:hypothetical protein [Flavivirga sp. 57AJ16]MDD7885076.1 hypothetical protein [Flavivirga sp. 57AJ16]
MDAIREIILTALLFSSCVFVVFFLARFNYLIKKLAAEKGFDPIRNREKYGFIEIGCIILGLGVGFGICAIYTTINLPEDTFYFIVYSTLFICGGIGLLAAHFMRKKFGKKE